MIRTVLSQLAVLSAVCTAVLIVCPDGSLKKYVRFSCSLCALSLLISALPVGTRLPELGTQSVSVADMTDQARLMIADQTAERLKEAVISLCETKYGVTPEEVNIDISDNENGSLELKGVRIRLGGLKYAVLTVPVKNSVNELLCAPCEVTAE